MLLAFDGGILRVGGEGLRYGRIGGRYVRYGWVDGMGEGMGLRVGFININDMYNNDVGKGVVYAGVVLVSISCCLAGTNPRSPNPRKRS